MNIVVLIKQVPDTESVIQLSDSGNVIDQEEIKWVINPYDEYALEEALLIQESRDDVQVTVLTAGGEKADQSIRTAYALGVDEGIRIDTVEISDLDPIATARILAAALKKGEYDLVLAGLRAVDDDHYQVPAMIAEELKLPLVVNVIQQQIEGQTIICHQQIDGGFARVKADLPAVLSVQKGINEPRYPNMRAMMKARKRPVNVLPLSEIGLAADSFLSEQTRLRVVSLAYAPQRSPGQVIEGANAAAKAEELVKLLKENLDVI